MMDQDTIWIRKIASGDRASFEELFRAYHRRVFGYIFRMIGETTRAEEITSDVLFEVWKGAVQFGGRSRVSTWIFGIAHHKVIDEIRRRKIETTPLVPDEFVDPSENPESGAIRESQREHLRATLARLTPEHREVIELAFFQDCSVEEIAGIIQCPASTVKTRMFYARKKLREFLGEMQMRGERL